MTSGREYKGEPVLDKLFDKVEGKLFVVWSFFGNHRVTRDELRPEFFLMLATAAVVAMHEDRPQKRFKFKHQEPAQSRLDHICLFCRSAPSFFACYLN